MARPLRIEYPGALYHVTSRGNRRHSIYSDDRDRYIFLDILGEASYRCHWRILAYCLMGNHYHLLVETPEGNLSAGMRYLNGVFSQAVNRRHERIGHVFQGRYKAILVDAQSYLLEAARYVVLNPVRAGLVELPEQWQWSSYQGAVGLVDSPAWLDTHRLLANFGNDRSKFRRFVMAGIGSELWHGLSQQIFLGDENFVRTAQVHAAPDQAGIPAIQQRPPAPPLEARSVKTAARNRAIRCAYSSGAYSYRELATHFGLHPSTIGYIVTRKS